MADQSLLYIPQVETFEQSTVSTDLTDNNHVSVMCSDNRGKLEIVRNNSQGERDSAIETISVIVEEPWSETLESLLHSWKTKAETDAKEHEHAGYNTKFKHRFLGFCLILTSTLNFIINSLFSTCEEDADKSLIVVSAGVNLFLNALITQLDLQEKYRLHFDYQIKLQDLSYDIEYVLNRGTEYRPAADQFLTEVKERKKLLDTAPEPPQGRCFFC